MSRSPGCRSRDGRGVAEGRDAGQNQALLAPADGPAEQLGVAVCSLLVEHRAIQALEGKVAALLRELHFRSAPVGGYPPDLVTPRPIRREIDVSAVSRRSNSMKDWV
jgi:hypothetical protein